MWRASVLVFLMLLGRPSAYAQPAEDAAALIAEFSGEGEPKQRSADELTRAFDAVLGSLVPGMGAETIAEREKPQQTLERICHRAGRPGAEAERTALCAAMAKRLVPATPTAVRVWLLRKLEPLGNAECVEALAGCLADPDPAVNDAARRALQSNPAPAAREALGQALDSAATPAARVAFLHALAARRERETLSVLLSRATDPDDSVAAAALAGLGEIGDDNCLTTLVSTWSSGDPLRRRAAGGSILRISERLIAEGKGQPTSAFYTTLIQSAPPPHRLAAGLVGLARSQGEAALPTLRKHYRESQAAHVAPIAARIAGEIPGPAVTAALVEDLKSAPIEVQPVLLDVLSDRADKSALPAVLEATRSADETVRVAAIAALRTLAGPAEIGALAELAATLDGASKKAARETLAALPSPEVDAALLAAVQAQRTPATRVEFVRALAARRYRPAVPVLFDLTGVQGPDVQAAACEALGELAREADIARCVQVVLAANAELCPKAEDMLAAVCLRTADRDRRAGPLLDALPAAKSPQRPALVRVLGRLEGDAALAAVRRTAEKGSDPESADAAIRALAGWSSIEVLPDLETIIADPGVTDVHRTLAVRGLTRLIKLPSDRTPAQTLALLEQTWKHCRRPDEKKAVLGALGDVRAIEALALARSALADAELKDEAATATIAIARNLAVSHRDQAEQAIRAVEQSDATDKPRSAAKEAREWLAKFDGYVSAWHYCGPYAQKGKASAALIDVAFPPEPGNPPLPDEATGAPTPEWKPLTNFAAGNPWIADFTAIDNGVSRCIYVRTTIVSDKAQPARLEIGSDDGVAVWFNGEPVHKKAGIRGLTPGDDKVDVTLKAGENALLLKVAQGDGAWGVCCGVRARDGSRLDGLTFRSE